MAEAAPATVPALLAHLVATRRDHPAVVMAHDAVTFAELDARSARMARALLAAGAGKGARIGLLMPDGIEWVVAFFASLRIGALLTCISTLCTPGELAHILRNSDCQMLLAARRYLGHDYAATLEAALPGLARQNAGKLRVECAPFLRQVWIDDAAGLGWAQPLKALLALADAPDAPDTALLNAAEREVTPGDDAIVIHTSGSTALPKAVVHRHWAIARHSPELARQFALSPDDRMMPLLPAFWLAGLSTMTQTLAIGATVIYPASPAVHDALDMIERFGVTRVNAWGDRQPRLVEGARARGIAIDHIPELTGFRDSAGNAIGTAIAMFGMTETFSAHSALPVDQPLPSDKQGSFGRAIDGYERRVVDPGTGAVLPPGEAGELQVRGQALMSGFYKRRRDEVFTPDGFYPTRDLVRIDADGWLYPAGRIDDMIKSRGANVSRLEVEAALVALPGVRAAVVAGVPHEAFGRMVVAAVVPEPGPESGPEPTEAGLKAALRETLSSYKVPRRIVFVAEADIARTATGKIRLAELGAMIESRLGAG